MEAKSTCAACGKVKQLCRSLRIDGVQQPHICKSCLIKSMRTRENIVDDLLWMQQLQDAGDVESLNNLSKQEE